MDLAYYFELWQEMMRSKEPGVADSVAWWQELFVRFYQAFIDGDRWQQYLEGVGVTLVATAIALAIGMVLGVLVAVIRTAHDQQRPGRP